MNQPIRIAIFASGSGSNALNLLRASLELEDRVQISLVISDNPDAPVLSKASAFPTKTLLIEKTESRKAHESEILNVLKNHQIDWIFLAGYMRLLSPDFVNTWKRLHAGAEQIVNIHPSKLPQYAGLEAVHRAFVAQEKEIGVTLHFVDSGMDTGRIIDQKILSIPENHSLEELIMDVHQLEHQIYREFLNKIAFQIMPTARYQGSPL